MEASLRRTARSPLTAEALVTQVCAGVVLAALVVVLDHARRIRMAIAIASIVLAVVIGSRAPALGAVALFAIAIIVGATTHVDAFSKDASGARPSRFDGLLFVVATIVAACVSVLVLQRHIISGDEWADTFQADLFAHFKAYASPFPCSNAFRAWWVFDYHGRTFAQYTPGWPLIMAPFQRAGIVWLANPIVFGVGVVGVARLARRAVGTELAGIIAALALVASPAAVLNAASRYPHTAVCTTFAWLIEAAFVLRTKDAKLRWGVLLGGAAAMLLSIRPLDGVTLGAPIALFVAWIAVTKQTSARLLGAAAAAFIAIGGATLVILRLQLGEWFKTGYAIAGDLRELPPVSFSLPSFTELGAALALDRGPAWWWPCNIALAALGLLLVRNRARALVVVLGVAALVHALTYAMVNFARSAEDLGYGPRYDLPLVVPFAVGTSIAITTLVTRFRAREIGRMFVVLPALAIAIAVVVDARVYPRFHAVLQEKRALFATIERANLHNAVVVVTLGGLAVQPWDLTQNLPSIENPDVYILTDWGAGEDMACARRRFADRTWYRAKGLDEVKLEPYR